MNGAVTAFGNQKGGYGLIFFKIEDFKSQDIVFWELDENYNKKIGGGTDIFNDASNFPNEAITQRHGGAKAGKSAGGILTTFGGSVEWIATGEYEKEANGSRGRTRLYCVPKKYSARGDGT
jgi:hypothetical protein